MSLDLLVLLDLLDPEVLLDLLVLQVRMVCLVFLDQLDLLDLVVVLGRWDLLVLLDLLDPQDLLVPLVVDSSLASLPTRRRPLIPSGCSVLMMLMFSVIVTWRWTAPSRALVNRLSRSVALMEPERTPPEPAETSRCATQTGRAASTGLTLTRAALRMPLRSTAIWTLERPV